MTTVTKDIEKKIYRISRKLYNKALGEIKMKDLSGAINSLVKSVEFDKSFTDARNLLGLVYNEVGQVGEAIDQWKISAQLDGEAENLAVGYLQQSNGKYKRHVVKVAPTIMMYNEALNHIAGNSEDLAMIKLKKAISLNPKFIQAQNLLALCYYKNEEEHKALTILQQVLKMDIRNAFAMSLKEEILDVVESDNTHQHGEAIQKTLKEESARGNSFTMAPVFHNRRKEKGIASLSQIVVFILGILIGLAAMNYLFTPDKLSRLEDKSEQMRQEYEAVKKDLQSQVAEKEETVNELTKKLDKLGVRLDEAKTTETQSEDMGKLLLLMMRFADGEIIPVAKELGTISLDGLSIEGKQLLGYLKEKTYPEAGKAANKEGEVFYNNKQYAQSLEKHQEAVSYRIDDTWTEVSYYRIARNYQLLGEVDNALAAFDVFFSKYNSGKFYNWSKDSYAQLQKQKSQ